MADLKEEQEEEEFEVERVLAKKGGQYHVKWKGWPLSDATWEPLANLAGAKEMIAEFEQDNKKKRGAPTKRPKKIVAAAAQRKKKKKSTTTTTAASAASASPAASPAASPSNAPVQWFVEVLTYCSGHGCYAGSSPSEQPEPTRVSHGPLRLKAEAIEKARQLRDSEPGFEDWAVEHYGSRGPPYDSADGENYDEDEFVSIHLSSSAEREAAASKLAAKAARELAKATKSVARPLPPMPAGGFVGNVPSLKVVQDMQLFARNPAPAVLEGVRTPASAYPNRGQGGFVHMLQRLSDMCYSVAAYCDDPTRGARYALKKYRAMSKSVVWVPPPECSLGGRLAPSPETVVDLVHTDLINPNTGQATWTKTTLLAAVSGNTTHLFLNDAKAHHEATLVEAIGKCGDLKVVVFVECDLSAKVLCALATKGASLRGLHCFGCSMSGADADWVPLLRSSPGLLWLGLHLRPMSFGRLAWGAIPSTVRMLEVECVGYGESLKTNLLALEAPMVAALQRMTDLKYLMVNRQKAGKGCVERKPGGGVKINVKIHKQVNFDYW